ncbi:MAG: hypothetical protein VX252_05080, partial [Myxococcota bacterium]|nr:hypothetical protein [Myxococcota bacterium]
MRSVSAQKKTASGPVELCRSPESNKTGRRSSRIRNARRALAALALAAWCFMGTGAASAYTLAELIDDQTAFSSLSETVVFSDFALLSTGVDESILELYEVIPHRLGFWVFSPDYEATDPGEIAFSSQAEAASGLNIGGTSLSMTRLEEADMDASGAMWVENLSGALLAELDVAIQNGAIPGCGSSPCSRRYDSDVAFIAATSVLQISTSIESGTPPV